MLNIMSYYRRLIRFPGASALNGLDKITLCVTPLSDRDATVSDLFIRSSLSTDLPIQLLHNVD
jgi:hypothetical protein